MKDDSGEAGEELLVYVHHVINEYQLRLDVQRFLQLVY